MKYFILNIFILIITCTLIKRSVSEERPHTIKFHVPNDVSKSGRSCNERYPFTTKICPIFGIKTSEGDREMSQDEIEQRCAIYGFDSCIKQGKNLFIDGSCRNCPPGLELIYENGNVYCSNDDASIQEYKNLVNPFDCIAPEGSLTISRTEKGVYRPCYNLEDNIQMVDIDHYVSSNDLSDLLTLTQCASKIEKYLNETNNLEQYKLDTQEFEIDRKMEFIPFAAVGSLDDAIYTEAGYLQCTQGKKGSKDYATPAFLTYYSLNIIAVAYMAFFAFLKYFLEMDIKRNTKNMTFSNTQSTTDAFEEAQFLAQTNSTQKGYKTTFFGTIAYWVFIIFSINIVVFLIIIVLDMFGVNYFLLCRGQPDVDAACEKSISDGVDPNWRMGWVCANGCFLDQATTLGNDPEWPYYPIPGGGSKVGIAFVVMWHVTFVWLIFIKMFTAQITSFFYVRCPVSTATHILIEKPIEEEIITQSNSKSYIRHITNILSEYVYKLKGRPCHRKLCKIQQGSGIRYFDFQCLRYCWNDSSNQYQVSNFPIEDTQRNILDNYKDGLSDSTAFNRYKIWGSNAIDIDIPPLIFAIFAEFFDYLYMYQLLTLLNWIYTNYYVPPIVSFTIIIISATVRIVTKRKSQWKVKKMVHKSIPINVCRSGKWLTMESVNLVPGDLIQLTESCQIPCDAVLIDGRCILDESTLTGEPTPVPKISLNPTSDQLYDNSQSNMKYTLYAGSYLQSFSPGRSGYTLAVVFATGASTYKGKLIRDLLFPPPISFTFEQHVYAVYCVLFLWGIVVMAIIIWFLEGVLSSWVLSTFVVSHIVNPLIPAVYVAALSQGAIHLAKNKVYCINFQRMSVAGKIKTFCFDKTGTLTLPGLEFRGLQYYTKGSSKFEQYGVHDKYPRIVKMLCGSCNEIDFINMNGVYQSVGNEVDVALFDSSGYEYELINNISVIKQGSNKIKILRRFEFDRATMTMSVIVEDETGAKYVFTKGSYEVISRIVDPDSLPRDYFQKADSLAKKGNYILGMGYRQISDDEVINQDVFKASRTDVESNLLCLGLIMFENPLKPDTPAVIEEIKAGKIDTRILTGDNSLTASYIARLSGISTAKWMIIGDLESSKSDVVIWKDFDTDQVVNHPLKSIDRLKSGEMDVAITGRLYLKLHEIRHQQHKAKGNLIHSDHHQTLSLALDDSELSTLLPYIKVYSRLTPDQKVLVMAEQMQLQLTGMCGDGANDVGALRLAHCGIAVAAGSSEAGIVSHFSSPNSSLESVVHVLKEGRSTLSKAMSGFKTLIVFGQTKGLIGIMQHYFAVIPAEFFWITWDGIVYVGMSWCLLQSHPAKRLSGTRPTAKMFGFETLFSTLSTIILNYAFFCGGIAFLYTFEWFLCYEFNPNNIDHLMWWIKGDNYEAAIMSYMATFNFLGTPLVYNFGHKYRTHWYKNYWLIIFFLLCLALYSYVFLGGPTWLSCLARINCGDQSTIKAWIETKYGNLTITEPPSNAPEGCPCNTQYGAPETGYANCNNSDLFMGCCSDEYVSCSNPMYNSGIHHNIIPTADSWKFWFLGMGNVVTIVLWEAIVVLGPVRTWAKQWKKNRKAQQQKH